MIRSVSVAIALTVLLGISVTWTTTRAVAPPKENGSKGAPITVPKGFKAELLYKVPNGQGSWVSLTVDNKGRLLTSDQYGGLYRITPPEIGKAGAETKVEPLKAKIGSAHGLLYANDSLYLVVGESRRGPGMYRLKDTTGDDQFDQIVKIRDLKGQGEHGPHAVVKGPDGMIYLCAGNHTNLPNVEASVVPRKWNEDFLLGRQWDARGHARGRMAPGGWIVRMDPEGVRWDLVSIGYRNQYDIAFNTDGELFTYDADMEWDIGAPWYRPTRVCHVTSGSEFGWRSGTAKWPPYFPDSLPAVVDIGPGSPTGIVFGTGAKFPAKYQKALFICDWSYGKVYAVHMEPKGSTYVGKTEPFAQGAPLPATDIVINPKDGAMYFTAGGRKVESALYRVTYVGKESTKPAKAPRDAAAGLRGIRRELEKLHGRATEGAVDKAWPYLGHKDRFIRYAARIVLEHQPVKEWQQKALTEKNPSALINASVALARHGDSSLRPEMVKALSGLKFDALAKQQKLELLRAYALAFIRLGQPTEKERQMAIAQFNSHYPTKNEALNRELSRVLVYLKAPQVVERTLALLDKAGSQEEQIHYAFCLRNHKSGWTIPLRKKYFQWFNKQALAHRGGASFGGFLNNIKKEAIASLNAAEKEQLQKVISFRAPRVDPGKIDRPFVKKWTVEELLPLVEKGLKDRNFAQGRKVFSEATCFRCHRFAGIGGIVGPDLSGVGGRFSHRDLLDSMVDPNKVISDQYQATIFELANGKTVVGRVANLGGDRISIMTNMLDPGNFTNVKAGDIENRFPSKVSMMPANLLDTFTKEEILDLMAYLRSGGNPNDPVFKK